MTDDTKAVLNEHDADEWFDVALAVNPAMTREQFNADRIEFQAMKRNTKRNGGRIDR